MTLCSETQEHRRLGPSLSSGPAWRPRSAGGLALHSPQVPCEPLLGDPGAPAAWPFTLRRSCSETQERRRLGLSIINVSAARIGFRHTSVQRGNHGDERYIVRKMIFYSSFNFTDNSFKPKICLIQNTLKTMITHLKILKCLW